MSDIMLNVSVLNSYASRISNVVLRMTRLNSRLLALQNQEINFGSKIFYSDILTKYNYKLSNCQIFLEDTAKEFRIIESAIICGVETIYDAKTIQLPFLNWYWPKNQKLLQLLFYSSTGSTLIGCNAAESALNSLWSGFFEYNKGDTTVSASTEYFKYENKKAEKIVKQSKKSFVDNLPDEDFYDKPKGTIFDATIEKTIEHNALDDGLSGDVGFAEGSINLKLGHYEQFHSSASVGLYVYDKKGNKLLSPGVSAEIGTSVALVQVSADGRIGLGEDNKLLGLYGNVEAEELSAELKGKFAVNKNEIYAGLDAEADFVKLSGSGGISVLGTDVGVSGSLKFGIGAHADVGFTDGKFKVDVGAAFGFGFDLGFEVDVSGTVDAVVSGAQSIVNGTVDFVSDVADGVGDFFSDVGDFFSDVGGLFSF